ncbi:MAG: exo-alpha-sialidase [Bryobacteraceae bacterium]|nr:exo-alpha-sialidase [Bryobacteraceae bacterium]MDW8378438.1 sialidase family protein [Bryobacterales bacterium]
MILGFFLWTAQLAQGEIQTERVFGPETPTGPYKHPASITELHNGDLFLVFYGGKGEYANDTSVYGALKKKGAKTWSEPKVLAHDPFRSVGNSVIWEAPDRTLWLFYVIRFGDTWSKSRIAAKISQDSGQTWSDSSLIALDEGMMVRGRPIVLSNGDYLLPVYHEVGDDREAVGAASTSLFLRYRPQTKEWTPTGRIRSPKGNIQPAAVEIRPGWIVAYCRRGGNYGPTTNGWLVRAESKDYGETWSEGRDSAFPNPNAAVDFLKLRSGHLLLVFNDSMTKRTPLTVALSTDQDRSYPYRKNLAEGPGDFAYPTAIQTADGKIHVVYTSDRRSVIRHAVFTEEDILR